MPPKLELEELIRSFSENDKIVIGADLNGHIGGGNTGYERWQEKNQNQKCIYSILTKSVCIQRNNETILDQGTSIKTSLVANIRAAYYIINNFLHITS